MTVTYVDHLVDNGLSPKPSCRYKWVFAFQGNDLVIAGTCLNVHHSADVLVQTSIIEHI